MERGPEGSRRPALEELVVGAGAEVKTVRIPGFFSRDSCDAGG